VTGLVKIELKKTCRLTLSHGKTLMQMKLVLPLIFLIPIPALAQAPNSVEISGVLSYPSDYIPADLEVCAQQISNPSNMFCTKKKFKISGEFGYRINLPIGEYYVFASTKDLPNQKAFYTEFVVCGMDRHCTSHRKIKIIVDGKRSKLSNIDPGDWYGPR